MEQFNFEKVNNIDICVSKEHKFGTDAFLLANFASPRRDSIVCDFGTGCGIIPLIWISTINFDRPPIGIDIQSKAIKQFNITIKNNNLDNKVFADVVDIKDIHISKNVHPKLERGKFTLITCNPPYKVNKAGILSSTTSKKIARHETLCNINDIAQSASLLLKPLGKFCICQRPERLVDCIYAMKNYGIEPKRLKFVQDKSKKAPWLFLLEGRKCANPFLNVEAPIIIRNDDGNFTKELLSIYGE